MTVRFISRLRKRVKKLKEAKTLKDYTKIVIETDEENPITIAVITADDVRPANGYRVRLTPTYES